MSLMLKIQQNKDSMRQAFSPVAFGWDLPSRVEKDEREKVWRQKTPRLMITGGKALLPPKRNGSYAGLHYSFRFKNELKADAHWVYEKSPKTYNASLWYSYQHNRYTVRVDKEYAKDFHRWLYKKGFRLNTTTNLWGYRKYRRHRKRSADAL